MAYQESDYNLLLVTREKLRIHEQQVTGKKVEICSDAALKNLLLRRPRYKKELAYIPGLGTDFMNKYGDEFMRAINKICDYDVYANRLNDEHINILKKYEARLINLNRRNRLLCTNQIRSKYGFDLYEAQDVNHIEDFILRRNNVSKVTLLSFTSKKDPVVRDKGRRLRNLIRETTKDSKESGTNDLYIGYPFIEGKIVKDDFVIRAPLMLFPVKVKESSTKIEMSLDEKRDIKYNSNLFLAFMRFNNIPNIEIPDMTVESINANAFIDQIAKFYEPTGLKFHKVMDLFSMFQNYSYETASQLVRENEFRLMNNAVLGDFPFFTSSIQSDIKKIINQKWVTNLVYELLIDTDTVDVLDNKVSMEETPFEFNEDEHCYINSLDYSQEGVLAKASTSDRLVIQGPPGTGKSQTITSVITDVVTQGKNVLVVSQKKAALDVIYNRLGELSKYSVMLTDLQNKGDFYSQVGNVIYNKQKNDFNEQKYKGVSSEVSFFLHQADDIRSALMENKNDPDHTDMTYVFEMNQDNFLTKDKEKEYQAYLDFSKFENKALQALKFDDYVKFYETFSEKHNLELFKEYIEYKLDGKWFVNLKKDLPIRDLANLQKEVSIFVKKSEEIKTMKGLIKKWFAKGRCRKALTNINAQYFKKSVDYNHFVKIAPALLAGLPKYRDMCIAYEAVHNFSTNTVVYGNTLFLIAKEYNVSLEVANKYYFDYLAYTYINNFETYNTYVYGLMKNYKDILAKIYVYDRNKREMGKSKFIDYMNSLVSFNSCYEAKYQEVKHFKDTTKQPPISKFIDKYEFELFSNIRIWLMTPEVVSEVLPFKAGLFDYVIFDEASQLYVEKGIPSIYRGRNVIIAGDNKQLRPSSFGFTKVDSDDDEEEEDQAVSLDEESLLDLARFKYPQTMLNFHYRSRYGELINFSNFAFYDAKLNIAPNIEEPSVPPIEVLKVEDGVWDKRANRQEALKVVELIDDLLHNRQNNETIGVITFNVTQMNLIQDLLDDKCSKDEEFNLLLNKEYNRYEDGEDKSLFIKNIENVQGDERDVIIFSIAYAKDTRGKIIHNYGWLNQQGGENRLNVAITRAKQKIYLVCSLDSSLLGTDGLKNNGPKVFKKFMQYAEAVSNNDKELEKTILTSFTNGSNKYDVYNHTAIDLKNALEQLGIECELNVGVGTYYIDLAIKKNSKYVLGFEFDDSFKRFEKSREREIHRRRFLENKGWTIMRIFGALYWRDRDETIARIVDYYNKI